MLNKIILELDPLQLSALQNAFTVAIVHAQATLADIQRQVREQIDAQGNEKVANTPVDIPGHSPPGDSK